jgi:hypothetical protein
LAFHTDRANIGGDGLYVHDADSQNKYSLVPRSGRKIGLERISQETGLTMAQRFGRSRCTKINSSTDEDIRESEETMDFTETTDLQGACYEGVVCSEKVCSFAMNRVSENN